MTPQLEFRKLLITSKVLSSYIPSEKITVNIPIYETDNMAPYAIITNLPSMSADYASNSSNSVINEVQIQIWLPIDESYRSTEIRNAIKKVSESNRWFETFFDETQDAAVDELWCITIHFRKKGWY